jgi:hypothetical protein
MLILLYPGHGGVQLQYCHESLDRSFIHIYQRTQLGTETANIKAFKLVRDSGKLRKDFDCQLS